MKKTASLLANIGKVLLLPGFVYLFFFSVSSGKFGNASSIIMILQQTLAPTLISLAMCSNMICGRIDLSAGSIVMLSAMLGARLVNTAQIDVPVFAAVCIGSGLVLGIISVFLYLKMKVPAIVTALGICMIYEMLSNLSSISWVTAISGESTVLGRMPVNFIIFAAMFVLFYVIFNYSKFGYNVRAIGNGQNIARYSGINVKRNAFICYTLSGFFLGIAALLKISIQGSIDTAMYMSSTNIIFNCMLGIYIGLAIEKYCNLVIGILVGNIIMNMMASGLLSIGLSASLQDVASGLVLLVIMMFTCNNHRVLAFLERRKMRRDIISPGV
ncbi:MAG: Branched-chain amino acid ABC transporter, permease protein [Candidatus Uhrbacteria bacterium GW2011_GWD2_52_7]|uniref:Autoinducer 2 import system permease protein LsrD n=1 Tax=Candidatus Uhrbacteria bacterium GW2011_GWD2_52_7 TaxID=1618989 RepID=A0A0G2A7L5_9BACT|nr:MAG: Branched-chain amino acid ABC transporter, permease protein [Candidatus Uhrbacteria bacterium GW2011_GWD2_52_7]